RGHGPVRRLPDPGAGDVELGGTLPPQPGGAPGASVPAPGPLARDPATSPAAAPGGPAGGPALGRGRIAWRCRCDFPPPGGIRVSLSAGDEPRDDARCGAPARRRVPTAEPGGGPAAMAGRRPPAAAGHPGWQDPGPRPAPRP